MESHTRYKFARLNRNLSLETASRRSKLSVDRIKEIEAGEGEPPHTMKEALLLANVYGWILDAIIGKHKNQSTIDQRIEMKLKEMDSK